MNYEHREHIGTILPPFDLGRKRPTKNGWYLDFTLETAGKVMPCRVFEEVFETASDLFAVGKKIALFGYLAGEQLRVKVARAPERPAVKKHLAFNGQTQEEAAAAFRARTREMAAKGFVPVVEDSRVSWHPTDYTVEVNGKHMLKVDFACDKLGGHYVAHKLKNANFVRVTPGKATIRGRFRAQYLEAVNELVEEAKQVDEVSF